jgi:hypothetical protein
VGTDPLREQVDNGSLAAKSDWVSQCGVLLAIITRCYQATSAANGDRGRDGLRHPALRTVQAVFPHMALQSAVIASGLSRRGPGRFQCEQPEVREVGIWPRLADEQARRKTPPKRVRHPAGCSFASGCSPPLHCCDAVAFGYMGSDLPWSELALNLTTQHHERTQGRPSKAATNGASAVAAAPWGAESRRT